MNNPYKAPAEEDKTVSKKELYEASNKQKKKVLIIITILFGVIGAVGSIDKDVKIAGSIMAGLFVSLMVGIPLLFFYVFTKKR